MTRFSPYHPNLGITDQWWNGNALKETQTRFYALDLKNGRKLMTDSICYLKLHVKKRRKKMVRCVTLLLLMIYDQVIPRSDSYQRRGHKVITFTNILQHDVFLWLVSCNWFWNIAGGRCVACCRNARLLLLWVVNKIRRVHSTNICRFVPLSIQRNAWWRSHSSGWRMIRYSAF